MLTSAEIRRRFIDYFVETHGHMFAPSSPVVPHDDPTLLFTNAGMNQFKPIFLGQADPSSDLARLRRAVNSQKCIRAGGKHNDLDDVGKDLYHHTFFEMLGNWSFGDYFKNDAIDWAWDLLTRELGVDGGRLYATYFRGDAGQGLEPDEEARNLWLRHLPPDRVLPGGMKDNFWEMGDTGPCGPCSEIHIDSRPDDQRAATPGAGLVNADHPDVIELWNLVFIQFNRTESGLRPLPAKHVDTGMGLERLARVLQGKRSNYDTDLFTPLFEKIRAVAGAEPYGGTLDAPRDIAYRVIADHIRTLVFAITDGADPSNEGRGYVLRRILRRAVFFGHAHLHRHEPFLCELAPTVVEMMGGFFPELTKNPQRVIDILRKEEEAFRRTIQLGLRIFEAMVRGAYDDVVTRFVVKQHPNETVQWEETSSPESAHVERLLKYNIINSMTGEQRIETIRVQHEGARVRLMVDGPCTTDLGVARISGSHAFQLHDTYGFPIDLTQIMAEEEGLTVDVEGFERLMEEARERSRAGGAGGAADPALALTTDAVASIGAMNVKPTDDAAKYDAELRTIGATVRAIWNGTDFDEVATAGSASATARLAVILDRTNFYAQSGGQIGDAGRLVVTREAKTSARDAHEGGEFIVEDTRATAGYVLHIGGVRKGELRVGDRVECRLDKPRRRKIMANHTATHLLNFALRETLGEHVEQTGSLVADDRLRFDFSHGEPVSSAAAERIERVVRERIARDLEVFAAEAPLDRARAIAGVRAVFGEAYPDPVRVVSLGAPIEAMLERPDAAAWRGFSVEFCGGTHVARTGAIAVAALVSEEPVAKGVRRVVCLTGDAAAMAIRAGADLRRRVESAASLPTDALDAECHALAAALESTVAPLTDRSAVRAALDALRERAKAATKQARASGRDAAVEGARAVASSASGGDVVAVIDAGGDRVALLAAMDAVRAKRPGDAVMLLSVDAEAGKVTIVASVPEARVRAGLKAGEWVRVAASACGGKGGGRPDSAQGGGTAPEKIGDAIDAARAFATERSGG